MGSQVARRMTVERKDSGRMGGQTAQQRTSSEDWMCATTDPSGKDQASEAKD